MAMGINFININYNYTPEDQNIFIGTVNFIPSTVLIIPTTLFRLLFSMYNSKSKRRDVPHTMSRLSLLHILVYFLALPIPTSLFLYLYLFFKDLRSFKGGAVLVYTRARFIYTSRASSVYVLYSS